MRLKILAAVMAALMLVGAAVAFAQADTDTEPDGPAVVEGVQVLEGTLDIRENVNGGWNLYAATAQRNLKPFSIRVLVDGHPSAFGVPDGVYDVQVAFGGSSEGGRPFTGYEVIAEYRVTLGS